jgi:Acyl-CoA reductase (LuxC)
MTTAERLEIVGNAAGHFPFLGKTTSVELQEMLRNELGHAEALDRFVPRGSGYVRAVAPAEILHILAGNTPAAALQSLIRGLVLGSHNRLKLPSDGLPVVEAFRNLLPNELANLVEMSGDLPDVWLTSAEAVVVFGNDNTIEDFQWRVRPDQVFVRHGHRISFGVIYGDPKYMSIDAAAEDASAFDQLGCLSPQIYYVAGDAREYAERLAGAMASHAIFNPRGAVALNVSKAIRALREETRFRAAANEPCRVWQSDDSTEWTVIYDEAPGFPSSPLHRTIFVKPLPVDLSQELCKVRKHLSCVGIFPSTSENAEKVAGCGASRICPIGRMQTPPWTWPQDGQQTLAPLVKWISFEEG